METHNIIDELIFRYEEAITLTTEFKERAIYHIVIDDLNKIKNSLLLTNEQKIDLEWSNTNQLSNNS